MFNGVDTAISGLDNFIQDDKGSLLKWSACVSSMLVYAPVYITCKLASSTKVSTALV